MHIAEIILIALGLSMDAAAVTMTNGMVYGNCSPGKKIAMPLLFGGFQALMPILGYYAGSFLGDFMNTYASYIVLIILGALGIKMIVEGLRKHENRAKPALTYPVLLTQAVVTSIDAFAVGVGFAALNADVITAGAIIGCVTAVITFISIFIGRKFGDLLGSKAEILGGAILIAIGINSAIF